MATTGTRFITRSVRPGSSTFNFNGSMWSHPFYRSFSSPSSAAAPQIEPMGLEVLGVKDYEDYRRSLYGQITHKALLVDAVGTLLAPSQPMAQIYREIGKKYGVEFSEAEILSRYRRAYAQPWGRSRLRYVNDGRPFWQYIVTSSTGCSDSQYFEDLYNYYTTDKAWHLCDPEAEKVFKALRKAGVKVAVVSNFDTRLRPVLRALNCEHWFDAVAVSAEVGAEKPSPTIFLKVCELLEIQPEDAVHVGDDRRNDIWGARDAGRSKDRSPSVEDQFFGVEVVLTSSVHSLGVECVKERCYACTGR
ncbi:hypothetical protein V6N13_110406 [Hibiscus sabdariffa]|uniref:Haloacid dehalogenase-like hydrolase domain-containing protein 3 n=1 Tax=Hibiscus sabdariffa TaxID=183260 RepID=A0ABR2TH54_9ROSI